MSALELAFLAAFTAGIVKFITWSGCPWMLLRRHDGATTFHHCSKSRWHKDDHRDNDSHTYWTSHTPGAKQ